LIVLLGFISCKSKARYIELRDQGGGITKGTVLDDTAWQGVVKYYDSNNHYVGYNTYRNGIKNGTGVSYSNGVIEDSILFENGKKNGYAYSFNRNGKLSNKSFFYDDRIVGSVVDYDSLGKPRHYYYYTFDGDIIFQIKYQDSAVYHLGGYINFKVHDWTLDGKPGKVLFLYLFDPPHTESHYEIARLDSSKKIISSSIIERASFFYESVLEDLPPGQSYAVVFHMYNKDKGHDELIITEIR